jgi:hypothetical protein
LKAALEEKAARILDDVGMKTMHFRHGLSGVAARYLWTPGARLGSQQFAEAPQTKEKK